MYTLYLYQTFLDNGFSSNADDDKVVFVIDLLCDKYNITDLITAQHNVFYNLYKLYIHVRHVHVCVYLSFCGLSESHWSTSAVSCGSTALPVGSAGSS